MTSEDPGRLVDRVREGDGVAVEALLARYWPALLGYVRLHADPVVRRHESCADVALSVCREVLLAAGDFEYRGEPEFRKWLFQKAVAKLVDHRRYFLRAKRDAARELPIDAATGWSRLEHLYASVASPSHDATAREDLERFERAFAQLSPEQQQVITSARLLGQSHAEIAADLGKSVGAVRVLLHRALVRVGLLMDGAPRPVE